jgi:glycine oxidase
VPDIAELELVEASARLRPGTPDNLPVIGGGATRGLVWATGHHRNGILLAPLTAEAVLSAVRDGDPAPLGAGVAPERFRSRSARSEPPHELAGRPA